MDSLLDVFSGSPLEYKLTMWEAAVLDVGGLLRGEENKEATS